MDGPRHGRREHSCRLIGPSGLRTSTRCAAYGLGNHPGRRNPHPGDSMTGPGDERCQRAPARCGIVFQSTSLPAYERGSEKECHGCAPTKVRWQKQEEAEAVLLSLTPSVIGWNTAPRPIPTQLSGGRSASRHRPRAGEGPDGPAARRDHLGAIDPGWCVRSVNSFRDLGTKRAGPCMLATHEMGLRGR